MDCSMPGFPVHYQLPEPTQTPVHCHDVAVMFHGSDAIQPSLPLSSPSPPAFRLAKLIVFIGTQLNHFFLILLILQQCKFCYYTKPCANNCLFPFSCTFVTFLFLRENKLWGFFFFLTIQKQNFPFTHLSANLYLKLNNDLVRRRNSFFLGVVTLV